MKVRIMLLFCGLMFFVFAAYFYYHCKTGWQSDANQLDIKGSKVNAGYPISVVSRPIEVGAQHEPMIRKKELSSEKREIFMKALEDVKRWSLSRGYYAESDLADYKSYSEDNLINIANTGDMKALWILANKRYESNRLTEAAQLYRKCAIVGSVPSMQKLSQLAFERYSEKNPTARLEDLYAIGIDVGVWNLLARKRGHSAIEEYMHIPMPQYPVLKFKGVDEAQVIKDTNLKLDQYYIELESARREAGMEPFDNTATEPWKIINDIETNYYDPLVSDSDSRRLSEIYWK